jgi:hypothetical protein
MMYCAGTKRFAVPNARFLLHGIGMALPRNFRFEEKQLQEKISSMQTDGNNIARVISEATGKDVEDVARAIFDGTVLSAEEAKEWGLVQEIKIELFPRGSRVISIQPPIKAAEGDGPIEDQIALGDIVTPVMIESQTELLTTQATDIGALPLPRRDL